ncbi:MAG TPA: PQQ-dependent sugar dehydrogenase [Prolixibacteraceae bacterium]|nr:PQQ-dependent sugar dehydrogenase [Prolixibacteraceae bacterium]
MKTHNFLPEKLVPLLILFVLFSCRPQSPVNIEVMNRSAQNMEGAAANYQNYCAGCHGFNLEKFEHKDWMYGDSLNSVFESIKYGRIEMGMPGFEATFSDDEIRELADYTKKGIPQNRIQLGEKTDSAVHSSELHRFRVDTLVSGLDVPWGLEFLPNGDLLLSERSGMLYRFTASKELIPIRGLPEIFVKGQGGLMDLKLHPDYASNGWIYIAFSDVADEPGESGGNTSILRARIQDDRLTDVQKIFNGNPDTDKSYHFGCKIDFDKKGYLYFGIGDRGERDVNPQTLANANGKIHRIRDDGTIPDDNPFVAIDGACPSVYSFGHRNPQGIAVHPVTGDLWESEHGPKGGDELNRIKPGRNYGWPVISYGINYDGTRFTDLTEKEGMEQPVAYWDPSIAPCGMTFVTGSLFPRWQNNLLIGSLRFQYVERIELLRNRVVHREKLLEGIGRVRNVKISPEGLVYVAIEQPGKIIRLLPEDL